MRSESRAHIAIIKTEALSEFMLVISPPQQFRNLPRQKKQETERIEKIVEKANHEVALLSCRAESRHPAERPISSITGFLDFARNDGGTILRWRRRLARG